MDKKTNKKRRWPTMSYRDYIRKYGSEVNGLGQFYCKICKAWIPKQHWIHFKTKHRYKELPSIATK